MSVFLNYYFFKINCLDTFLTRILFCLFSLDDIESLPEECAELLFNGNMQGLRTAILNFGEVDCTYKPMDTLTANENMPTASIPETFEDYNDEEHHILYKTLQDLKKTNETSVSGVMRTNCIEIGVKLVGLKLILFNVIELKKKY